MCRTDHHRSQFRSGVGLYLADQLYPGDNEAQQLQTRVLEPLEVVEPGVDATAVTFDAHGRPDSLHSDMEVVSQAVSELICNRNIECRSGEGFDAAPYPARTV